MVSFSEFVIKLFEKFGIFYAFSVIFIAILVYIGIYTILSFFTTKDQSGKEIFNDKTKKVISSIFAIVASILAVHTYNISLMIRYLAAMISIFLAIIVFILISYSLAMQETPKISDNWKRNYGALIIVIIFIMTLVSLYYSFKSYFTALNLGKAGTESFFFSITWRPEILIIPFLFVFFGFVVYLVGKD